MTIRLCQHIIDMVTFQYAHTTKKRITWPVCSDVRRVSEKVQKTQTLLPDSTFGMVFTHVCRLDSFLGHFLLETENVFNCSRHQRLVTVAFRRCVKIFLLTFFRCINSSYHKWWHKKEKWSATDSNNILKWQLLPTWILLRLISVSAGSLLRICSILFSTSVTFGASSGNVLQGSALTRPAIMC